MRRFQRADRAIPVLIAILVFIAFLPALHAGFVSWDDDKNFLANPNYRGLGASQLRWMWTTFLLGHYVPLSWMTLGLDYSLWGMNPAGYHLTNILLHAANAVLMYFIARRILRLAGVIRVDADGLEVALPAAFAALVFAIHPLRVESVAWVTERRDVLSGFFYMACVLLYLRHVDDGQRHRRWYWMALAAFAGALLSKATAVTAPAVLLLLDVYPLRRLGGVHGWRSEGARRVYVELMPFAVLAAGAAALAFVALQQMVQLAPAQKIAVSAYSLSFYMLKTIAPWNLSPIYAMPDRIDPGAMQFLVSYAVAIALAVLLWVRRKRWPGAVIAGLTFFAIVFPMLGFHQNGPQIAADRYTYHAAPALAILAGAALAILWRRGAQVPVAIAGLLVATMGVLTWRQTEVWHDSTTLWSHVLELDSTSSYGNNNWGNVLMRQGNLAEAGAHYARAVVLAPDYAQAHNNLGIALARQGNLAEAIDQYRRAIALEPGYDEPHNNWGIAVVLQGDLDGAIDHYAKAIAINPDNADAEVNWGNALLRKGEPVRAIAHYRRALEIRPDEADAHLNWGVALAQWGKMPEAIEQFRQALLLNPDNAEAKRYIERAAKMR